MWQESAWQAGHRDSERKEPLRPFSLSPTSLPLARHRHKRGEHLAYLLRLFPEVSLDVTPASLSRGRLSPHPGHRPRAGDSQPSRRSPSTEPLSWQVLPGLSAP